MRRSDVDRDAGERGSRAAAYRRPGQRGLRVFDALALPVPPTRTGDDAPAPNRPRAMAAEHLRPLPPPPAAWPDPLRWLPSAEPNPRPRQDVRLSRYQFSNR